MGKKDKLSQENLNKIIEILIKKGVGWETALWELIQYLVELQFSKRNLLVSEEKRWDASTEMYIQLKKRIEDERTIDGDKNSKKRFPIKNIVAYVYYALPLRFKKWCENSMKELEREKNIIHYDAYSEEEKNKILHSAFDPELKTDLANFDNELSFEDVESQILKWVGKAENNIELKNRRTKLRAHGWEIKDKHLISTKESDKEMARELSILESKKEKLQNLEERRVRRIFYLKTKLKHFKN